VTSNFIRYDQDQQHLLPKYLSEVVEEDSLEQFVSDTIDYLDDQDRLEPFHPEETDENRGRLQYHSVMLLKILVFGYAQDIRSSRKIDRLLERDVAFRFLAANQQPDFCTISDFCKNHREDFQQPLRRDSVAMLLGWDGLDGRGRPRWSAGSGRRGTRSESHQRPHTRPDPGHPRRGGRDRRGIRAGE